MGSTDVWSHPNLHGDVAATTGPTGAKIGATFTYDPYGNPLGSLPDNSAGAMDYAWLGQHQRPLEHQAGLLPIIEMGARQYDPVLGRFLEVDPVEGGNDNDYVYVEDPVNMFDLDGQCGVGNPFKKCGKGHKGGTNILSGAASTVGRGARAAGGFVRRSRNTIMGVGALIAYGSCPFTGGVGCAVGQGLSVAALADSAISLGANCITRGRSSRSCQNAGISTALNAVAVLGPTARLARFSRAAHFTPMSRWLRVAGTNIRWGAGALGGSVWAG